MTKSTLNSKALQSATIGFLAAALVVGAITLGPGISHAIHGDALAASSNARTSFAVAKADAKVAPLKATKLSTTSPVAGSTYAVATMGTVVGDDSDSETKDN